jgi:hypothetical protein
MRRDLALDIAEGVDGGFSVRSSREMNDNRIEGTRGVGTALVGRFDIVGVFKAVVCNVHLISEGSRSAIQDYTVEKETVAVQPNIALPLI